MTSEQLILDLIENTRQNLNRVEKFREFSLEVLNKKSSKDSWSILECIEHLNLYGDFYLNEIDKRIKDSSKKVSPEFKAGMLGNYFVKLMKAAAKLKPMKTATDMNPNGSTLGVNILDRFSEQQQRLLDLLDRARQVSLTKTKTSITISKLIKLRLGDTLRFVVAHNERHIFQAEKMV